MAQGSFFTLNGSCLLFGWVWMVTKLFFFKVFNVPFLSLLLFFLSHAIGNYPYELDDDDEDGNCDNDVWIQDALFHWLELYFKLINYSALLIWIINFPSVNPFIKLLHWAWEFVVAEWNSSLNVVKNNIKRVCSIVLFVKFDNKIRGKSRVIWSTSLLIRQISQILVIYTGNISKIKGCQHHTNCCIMGTVEYEFWSCSCRGSF